MEHFAETDPARLQDRMHQLVMEIIMADPLKPAPRHVVADYLEEFFPQVRSIQLLIQRLRLYDHVSLWLFLKYPGEKRGKLTGLLCLPDTNELKLEVQYAVRYDGEKAWRLSKSLRAGALTYFDTAELCRFDFCTSMFNSKLDMSTLKQPFRDDQDFCLAPFILSTFAKPEKILWRYVVDNRYPGREQNNSAWGWFADKLSLGWLDDVK